MPKKKPTKGRPRKYLDKMCDDAIKEMSQGAAIEELPLVLKICPATIYDWMDTKSPRYNQDFSEAIKKGVKLSRAWWLKEGRKNLTKKEFSAALWYMNMKNRFGWRDKIEKEETVTHNHFFHNVIRKSLEQNFNREAAYN